jgi:hypothetical protein
MKSISVAHAMGDRIEQAAIARGIPMSELVERACADLPTEPKAVAALADRVWANMPRGSRTASGG